MYASRTSKHSFTMGFLFFYLKKNPLSFGFKCFHMKRNEGEINEDLWISIMEKKPPDNDNMREVSKTIKHQFIQ